MAGFLGEYFRYQISGEDRGFTLKQWRKRVSKMDDGNVAPYFSFTEWKWSPLNNFFSPYLAQRFSTSSTRERRMLLQVKVSSACFRSLISYLHRQTEISNLQAGWNLGTRSKRYYLTNLSTPTGKNLDFCGASRVSSLYLPERVKGSSHTGPRRDAPPVRGTFFRLQVYQRLGISPVKVSS